jgi:hypothetical protein
LNVIPLSLIIKFSSPVFVCTSFIAYCLN